MPSITQVHPHYTAAKPDWDLARDCYHGQRTIKERGFLYLPPTENMRLDNVEKRDTPGRKAYNTYRLRARFHNFLREAVHMAIGMLHSQPPEIKLPARMEGIRGRNGESLPVVLRNINTEQLITGRVGVLADIPTNAAVGEDIPYITTYGAELCINWDDGQFTSVPQLLNLVILNESEERITPSLNWENTDRYRALVMRDGEYMQGVFENEEYNTNSLRPITFRGNTLNQLPFFFINSCDITNLVDDPPLIDLANACITLYQSDADYRQNLFMQGQDTLVITGGQFTDDDDVRVGAGNRIDLGLTGDAKYIGVNSDGLSEQREAISNLISMASSMGAQTMDTVSRERESGDSLRIRVAARTADLNHIADTGAAGLEELLKTIARWMNEDPDEVSVRPNKEFGEMPMTGQNLVELCTARNLGAPISAETIHNLLVQRRITKLTFEEEIKRAANENRKADFPFEKIVEEDPAPTATNDQPTGEQ